MLSEELYQKHPINIFDTDRENSYIKISDYLYLHYIFEIVDALTCEECKWKKEPKIQVEDNITIYLQDVFPFIYLVRFIIEYSTSELRTV